MIAKVYCCGRCSALILSVDQSGVWTCPCGARGRFVFVGEATLTVKEPVPQSISTEGEQSAS